MENNHSDNEKLNRFPCPFCETLNNVNAKFCRKCGKNISSFCSMNNQRKENGRAVLSSNSTCPNCGATNNQDAVFCKGCGQKLANVIARQESTVIPVPIQEPEPQPSMDLTQMRDAEKTETVHQIQETIQVHDPIEQAAGLFCPSCGARNKSDAGFCKECGQKLSGNYTATAADQIQSVQAQVQQHKNISSIPPAASEPAIQIQNQKSANVERNRNSSVKKFLIPLLCLLLVLAGAGGLYLYKNGKIPMPGSDNPVKNYVEALNKNNYAAAFQMLNVKENAFVNATQFEKFVKSQLDQSESVYSKMQGRLDKIRTEKKRDTQNSVVFEVKATRDGQPVNFMLEMDKQTKKINLSEKEFGQVELEVPAGSEVKIDGVKVENGYKLEGLFAGRHALEIQNPLLELGYNKNLNFSPDKDKKVKLVHTAWLKANQIGVVDAASLAFINGILKATITNESLKHEVFKFKDDESITNMYQKINTYMLKNGITEMVMAEGKTTNPVYAADGKIHSQYDFSGTYKKGQGGRVMNANGSVQLEFDIEGNDVIVSKVDSYSLHVKK
ncbi:MAG: zinc ribbon domain-containing protein [Acidaminococcaceae bacterium]|nr:zinc ribbon domain-containing protein [Acidaminococcaceae bacterium]